MVLGLREASKLALVSKSQLKMKSQINQNRILSTAAWGGGGGHPESVEVEIGNVPLRRMGTLPGGVEHWSKVLLGRGTCQVTNVPGLVGFGLRILSRHMTGAHVTNVTMRLHF